MVRRFSKSSFRRKSGVKTFFEDFLYTLKNAKGVFIFGLIIGILLYYGLGIVPGFENITGLVVSTSNIESQVVKLYEIQNPGAYVELVDIIPEEGLYKVRANINGQLVENYVTRDGKWLIVDAINPELFVKTLESRKIFLDCLAGSGLKFFGSGQSQATLTQMQLLGGPTYLDQIYISCDGDNTQTCIDMGVTEVPAFVFNGQIYFGIKQVEELSGLTGCQFSA